MGIFFSVCLRRFYLIPLFDQMVYNHYNWLARRRKGKSRTFAKTVVSDQPAQSAQANPKRHFTTAVDFVRK